MSKQRVTDDAYLDIDDLAPDEAKASIDRAVADLKKHHPDAEDIRVVIDSDDGDAWECLRFTRLETDDEERQREERDKRLSADERQQYLRLKAKFEGTVAP